MTASEATEEKVTEVHEAGKVVEDNHQDQTPEAPAAAPEPAPAPAPAVTPILETPLTKELAKLKAEQARLKEIAGSFTISHVVPTETAASQSQGQSEGVQGPEENHIQGSEQEANGDGCQKQRDLEMESVD